MAFFGDADIAGMLADWGNTLTVSGVTKPCILDQFDELAMEVDGGAGQVKRQVSVIFRTNDFPTLRGGQAVTVDGVNYVAWKRLAIGDGALTTLVLAGSGEEVAPGILPLEQPIVLEPDGETNVFELPTEPANGIMLFWNGLLQSTPDDYTLSGSEITMELTPAVDDKLQAFYL